MDFLSPLLSDIWRHITEFDFSPPRTVDQLMGWVALAILLRGLYVTFKSYLARSYRTFVGILIPGTLFFNTVAYISVMNRYIDRVESEGFFDPRTKALVLASMIWDCFVYILFWFTILGAIYATFPNRFEIFCWAALGSGMHLFRMGADYRDLAKAIRGTPCTTLKHIKRADEILAEIPVDFEIKSNRAKKAMSELRENLPVLKTKLLQIRDAAT